MEIADYRVNWSASQRHEKTCLLLADDKTFFARAPLRHAAGFGTIHAEPLKRFTSTRQGTAEAAQGRGNPALAFISMAIMKVNLYIDGFNLYYGMLKGSPYKWLER